MTVPTRTPLGAPTNVRKWYLDVNTGTSTSPTWTPVRGIMSFTPNMTATQQDDSDFDSNGFKSTSVTAMSWGVTFDITRKVLAGSPTVYDAGQEFLRTTSRQLGVLNSVQIRFYEMSSGGPRVEAYQGNASVSWSPKGGAMDALDEVTVTLAGQGQQNVITHPDSTADAPVISSLSPTTAPVAGGELVAINGSYFTGATAVQVNAVNVASGDWAVVNDGLIEFVAPAEAAGAKAVTVITPAGTSNAVNLTYS